MSDDDDLRDNCDVQRFMQNCWCL